MSGKVSKPIKCEIGSSHNCTIEAVAYCREADGNFICENLAVGWCEEHLHRIINLQDGLKIRIEDLVRLVRIHRENLEAARAELAKWKRIANQLPKGGNKGRKRCKKIS